MGYLVRMQILPFIRLPAILLVIWYVIVREVNEVLLLNCVVSLCTAEVAEKVFNRCVKSNGYPVDHAQYGITLSYEFLDDVSHEWAGFMTSETSDHEGSGVDTMMYKIKSALPENASKQVEIKSNHPLMLMVRMKNM